MHSGGAQRVHGDQPDRRLVRRGDESGGGARSEAVHLLHARLPPRNALHRGRSARRPRELHLPLRTVPARLASMGRLPRLLRREEGDERMPRNPLRGNALDRKGVRQNRIRAGDERQADFAGHRLPRPLHDIHPPRKRLQGVLLPGHRRPQGTATARGVLREAPHLLGGHARLAFGIRHRREVT